jgi:hypothetical protein
MGFQPIEWWKFLFGTMPIALTALLLLKMDQYEQSAQPRPTPDCEAKNQIEASNDNEKERNGMSWAELVYNLFVRRKSLVALFVLCTTVTVLVTCFFVRSLVKVDNQGASGVVVQLPGETVYYTPIYPYAKWQEFPDSSWRETSWQNTGIDLEKGDEFTVEISGMVSPGSLQNVPDMAKWTEYNKAYWDCKAGLNEGCIVLPKPTPLKTPIMWPFTGPEGYSPEWYPNPNPSRSSLPQKGKPGYDYIERSFWDDQGLTVKGVPHNWVIGLILPEGDKPRQPKEEETPEKPSDSSSRQYDFGNDMDKTELVNLSCKEYPHDYLALKTGKLWVVINDADAFRWDNEGWFFLKLTKHVKGLPRKLNDGPCDIPQRESAGANTAKPWWRAVLAAW